MEEGTGSNDNDLSYAKLVSDESLADLNLRTETRNTSALFRKKRFLLILYLVFLAIEVIVAISVTRVVLATSKCSSAKGPVSRPVCEEPPKDKSADGASAERTYEDRVLHHDIQDLADTWTEDAVFINRHNQNHTLVEVHVGHDGLKKTFENWFDAGRIARSKVTTLHSGLVGDGIPYVVQDIESFDKDDNSIYSITQMAIYKHVGCELKTHMVVEL